MSQAPPVDASRSAPDQCCASPGNPGPAWHIKALGNFYSDSIVDLVWQNDSGEAAIWKSDGTNLLGGGSIGNPDPSWHVIAKS